MTLAAALGRVRPTDHEDPEMSEHPALLAARAAAALEAAVTSAEPIPAAAARAASDQEMEAEVRQAALDAVDLRNARHSRFFKAAMAAFNDAKLPWQAWFEPEHISPMMEILELSDQLAGSPAQGERAK